MSFNKHDATRLYKKLRSLEPNQPGVLGVPPSGVGIGVSGSVALAVSPATQTDVLDARITSTTVMTLAPQDLYGAAEIGAGNIYWTSPAAGIMRIFHTVSTKTRSFKYLLMFTLYLLFMSPAFAQQVYCDGVGQEVRPKLNLINSICTQDAPEADATNIDVAGWLGGTPMYQEFYAQGMYSATDPSSIVDRAEAAGCIDGDLDGFCNFKINVAGAFSVGTIDLDGDGNFELSFTPASITWFPSGTTPLTVTNQGQFFDGKSSIVRMGAGLQVGVPGTSPTIGVMSGIGREAATDRLFADRNTNFGTVTTREVTAASTNAGVGGIERYLENDNEQRRLTADHVQSGGAAATGTEVTGLSVPVNGIRTYDVTYTLLVTTGLDATGIGFAVNYENGAGAAANPFVCEMLAPTDDAAGVVATGNLLGVWNGAVGKAKEWWTAQAEATTVPSMGPTQGFTAGSVASGKPVMLTIHCLMTTPTGAGEIELWHASENANTTTVLAQSWVDVIAVQ